MSSRQHKQYNYSKLTEVRHNNKISNNNKIHTQANVVLYNYKS